MNFWGLQFRVALFNRSRAFRRGWECWAKGSWGCWAKALGRPLGGLLDMSWGSFLTSWGSLGGADGVPGRRWRPLWRPLGAPKPGWSAKAGASRGECGTPGAEKSSLDYVLAAPRPIPREVSAILEAEKLPKGRPRGPKIESKGRLKLKMRILLKVLFFQYNSLIFEVQGSLFGSQNRYTMALDCRLAA